MGRTVLVRESDAAGDALGCRDGSLMKLSPQCCPLAQDITAAMEVQAGDSSGGSVSRMALLRSALMKQGVTDQMENTYHTAMASAIEAWKKKQQCRQESSGG